MKKAEQDLFFWKVLLAQVLARTPLQRVRHRDLPKRGYEL